MTKYLTKHNGRTVLREAISDSRGSIDANQLIQTNENGILDVSFLYSLIVSHAFSFGDASAVIADLSEGQSLLKVIVNYETAFNGNGTLAIGTQSQPELLMSVEQSNPQSSESYETNPCFVANTSTQIYLTLLPDGETVGNGTIYLLIGTV